MGRIVAPENRARIRRSIPLYLFSGRNDPVNRQGRGCERLAEIYREMNELAEAGAAIVMASSDLPELLGMADRIVVMRRGRLVANLSARATTQEEILRYAAVEEEG